MIGELLGDPRLAHQRFANVRVDCITLWLPDSFIPEAHAPVDFFFALHADHVSWLSAASRAFVPIELDARAALVDAATLAASAPQRRPGVDTAVGRYLTTVTLRVDSPTRGGSFPAAALEINHAAYAIPPAPWQALFEQIVLRVGLFLGDSDRERLRFLGVTFPPSQGPLR